MDEMGRGFWLKMIGMVIGLGLLVLVSVLLVDRLVYRFGVWAGLVVIFGIAMVIAYRHDKKKQQEYEELP